MKCLITGGNGQLGFDLIKQLDHQENVSYLAPSKSKMDIRDKESVWNLVKEYHPDVLFHCAAYTAVDQAEEQVEEAFLVNEIGTKNIVESAKEIGAKVVYISTDYVFDGEKEGIYQVDDPANPKSIYGKSKWRGEEIVRSYPKHFIVRISWIFGIHGSNFVKTMLRLSENHVTLDVVCDQIGSPTYTADLAPLLIEMAKTEKYGTYHATNEGYCSWADFATYIFKVNQKEVCVHPVSTEEYQQKLQHQQASRPKNSRLSKKSLQEAGFLLLPRWEDAVERFSRLLKDERNDL